MMRWKCTCAYEGTAYCGWQLQDGQPSVQGTIEAALGRLLERPVRIHGSGRTDSGVHALGQVFHFDANWSHGTEDLLAALRTRLPPDIQVYRAVSAPPRWHARLSAVAKRYHYRLHLGQPSPFERRYVWAHPRPLDIDRIAAAARLLEGRHDFKGFRALGSSELESTVRHLRRLHVTRTGPRIRIVAEADGFLYKMARSLTGALIALGRGQITESDLTNLLRTGERGPHFETAPAHGLFLERVFYR
ncbi:MAG: tRNA pseudouridine(38-40) synthase TruA [Puniceicoccaceae bacterium]|nr:MAG: tRNA pseudouridine(38-40) synthase TruA [Puniceicoccaceae bacterium]